MSNPNRTNQPLTHEIKAYTDGSTMEVHREGSLSPRDLVERAKNTVRADLGGCFFVQTKYTDQNGNPQIRRFYVDGGAAVYRRGDGPNDLQGVRLPSTYLDDPASQITLGEQWVSPFGTTRGVVVVVGEAYGEGVVGEPTYVNHPMSPIGRGRELLDRVPPTATTPVSLLP